jgi:hypothetical protein
MPMKSQTVRILVMVLEICAVLLMLRFLGFLVTAGVALAYVGLRSSYRRWCSRRWPADMRAVFVAIVNVSVIGYASQSPNQARTAPRGPCRL